MQGQNQPTWYKLLTSTIDSLREARPVSDPNNRGEGQVVQLLQQNYLKVTSSVWPPLVKWLETSLAAVEHHLFFQNPEKKTS